MGSAVFGKVAALSKCRIAPFKIALVGLLAGVMTSLDDIALDLHDYIPQLVSSHAIPFIQV